ncbi:MAG: carboxypeptidase regulatory-like domain-containing protein, partial [Myxococcales bacterium]|nr:carboxypeptidase regulatory-like domain-containing protein [Myxococcales bacterium]
SYTRYFVVGNGDTTAVSAVRDAQTGVATGKVEGFVTSGGQPVAGARVSIVTIIPGPFLSGEVLGGFETDAEGHYIGTVPTGIHHLKVNADGHPDNVIRSVLIEGGATIHEDFDLLEAGALQVVIVDEGGQPIAGKVSVVGIDSSPSDNVKLDILGFITAKGGIFRTVSDQLPRGLAAVKHAPPSGLVPAFALEPGNYEVVVSHGPEYDVHREPIVVSAGVTTTVNATVRRVVDTTGFVGSDFHQHATASFDAPASDLARVTTNVAEGLDFFVSSDHDFVADLSGSLAAIGATGKIGYAFSLEVTPSDYGHINPWPIARIPGSRNFGAYDWGKGEAPGEDFPSFGNYARTPGEIYAALRLLDPDAGPEVIQMNHVNSQLQGTLDGLGIDTAQVPPQSLQSPAKFRLNPATANLFDPNFDAMELWIGSGNSNISLLIDESWGDWMNLLNQGLVKAATANSDSHITAMVQVGAPRTYVASSTDDPAAIDPDEIAQSVLDGKAICTNGPFVTLAIDAASTGESAGLGVGQPRIASTTDGVVDVTIHVQAAPWVSFDTVDLYVSTVPVGVDTDGDPTTPPVYGVTPQRTFVAGTDFVVTNVPVNGSTRQEATITTQLTGLGSTDQWVVAVVRGTQGTSPSLFPVIPNDIDEAQTYADLIVNTPGEGGVRALAFTNPLFVDANGNDVYDPPL